ncbi:hypothetical protein DMH18_18830 [Streptomyces sp. WAC 06783]|uniref:DUF1360 domain-containing protein n=1 Tax=Streptomyces sp. WAC 06783 TaxID=2203211 RepID=UPI000F73D12C|nr:DUF1360 domain-containing protein [Streptomyces sp. WAC 06783]RSO08873.1 hypothetical protein DMH18_18830 [Streptomyces sp. WAC 06783]
MAFNPLPEEGKPGGTADRAGSATDDGHRRCGAGHGDEAYAPGEGIPLRGYAVLAGGYAGATALFALAFRKSGRTLPSRVPPWDLLLLGAATYKASRLLAKDKITALVRAPFTRRKETISASEVMDEPRGHGLQLAVGELLACPFCLATWVGTSLVCGYAVAPRATRLVATGLSAVTISDWLQYAWSVTQERAEG